MGKLLPLQLVKVKDPSLNPVVANTAESYHMLKHQGKPAHYWLRMVKY